jgi:hypothetical protein
MGKLDTDQTPPRKTGLPPKLAMRQKFPEIQPRIGTDKHGLGFCAIAEEFLSVFICAHLWRV